MRRILVVCFGIAVAVSSRAAAISASPDSFVPDPLAQPRATLRSAHDALFAKIDAAKAHSDDAFDIVTRLAQATESLDEERTRTDAGYVREKILEANMDAAWVTAVTSGACLPPAPMGASETCVRSSVDGTLQPIAVYIPSSIVANAPTAVVVLLRGRGETETDLVSRADIRALADESHAILIAPYARGRALYDRPATSDVIDALDAAAHFATIDPKRTYLAGFSMGGIAAFHIAGFAPKRFVAMLSILGALENTDRDAILAFSGPIYVVNSERDELVPPSHGRSSVAYLRSSGRAATYYEQPGGEHSLRSVFPTLHRAWSDMFGGVVPHALERTPVTAPDLPLAPMPGHPT